jgi:hypothetical protein
MACLGILKMEITPLNALLESKKSNPALSYIKGKPDVFKSAWAASRIQFQEWPVPQTR